MNQASAATVILYRLIEEGLPPRRADRSALGLLPTRAVRHCQAVTTATGFGWWIFPPMDLTLLWDGSDIYWRQPGSDAWLVLLPSVQFPGMADRFDAVAPKTLRGSSPPFLTALPEPGVLQIWTGLFMRAAPGWSVLARAPANMPGPGGIVLFEGIVEADTYFGPVFINLRFTQSHKPVRLRADYPLAQLQPLPRSAYADDTLNSLNVVADIESMSSDDWEEFHQTIVAPNADPGRPLGGYATAARKRAKRERHSCENRAVGAC